MEKRTKDRINEAAFHLFSANGYEATTMDQIAVEVGIKKPTLYAYIKSKEELFLSIYEELQSDYCNYMEQLIAATESMPVGERLRLLFERYLGYFVENLERAAFWNRVLFFPPPSLKEKLIAKVYTREKSLGEKLIEILREGVRQGVLRNSPPEDMLLAYYSFRGGLLGLVIVFPPKEGHNVEKVDQVWQNFWLGIKKR